MQSILEMIFSRIDGVHGGLADFTLEKDRILFKKYSLNDVIEQWELTVKTQRVEPATKCDVCKTNSEKGLDRLGGLYLCRECKLITLIRNNLYWAIQRSVHIAGCNCYVCGSYEMTNMLMEEKSQGRI